MNNLVVTLLVQLMKVNAHVMRGGFQDDVVEMFLCEFKCRPPLLSTLGSSHTDGL